MSLRAFAVLAAVAAGGAALLFGPMAVLDAARWLRRRLGYEVPAPGSGLPLPAGCGNAGPGSGAAGAIRLYGAGTATAPGA